MKSMASQVRSLGILFLLGMAVWFTLPSTPTRSKYVWEDTQKITLTVQYTDAGTTSLFPEGNPAEFWGRQLTNIQATATEDGLLLKAEEGYTLPENITVTIGQKTFSIQTDGTQATDGITFDAATGLLSIPDTLIQQNPGRVTVSAVAVSVSIPAEDTAAVEGTQPIESTPAPEEPSAPESSPAAETTPQPEDSPAAESTPAPEQPPTPESTPAAETTPQPENSPAAESTPAPEEPSVPESSPAAEATPQPENSPAAAFWVKRPGTVGRSGPGNAPRPKQQEVLHWQKVQI